MKVQVLVARNIRRLRVGLSLSQESLATDAGIDRTYVSRLERAKENPTVAVLEKVASALNCDIRDLFDPARVTKPIRPLQSGRHARG